MPIKDKVKFNKHALSRRATLGQAWYVCPCFPFQHSVLRRLRLKPFPLHLIAPPWYPGSDKQRQPAFKRRLLPDDSDDKESNSGRQWVPSASKGWLSRTKTFPHICPSCLHLPAASSRPTLQGWMPSRPLHLTLKPISKNTFSLKYLQCGSYYSSIHQLSAHNNPPLGSKALLVPSPPIFSFSFTVVKEEAESKVSPKTHPWQKSFGTGALWVPLLGRVLSKRLTPSYSDLIRSQTRHTPGRLSPSQPALSGQLATTGHHW